MSCVRKIEYCMIPLEAYQIIRNCPGCGTKKHYVNTGNFRINANGRRIDVWLIYQCEKCKSTYNLTILERVRPEDISPDSYRKFLSNDRELAIEYGCNRQILSKNRAEPDWEHISYEITGGEAGLKEEEYPENHNYQEHNAEGKNSQKEGACLVIYNPYELKIRTDKILAEIFQVSRSKVKQLEKKGFLVSGNASGDDTAMQYTPASDNALPKYPGKKTEVYLNFSII